MQELLISLGQEYAGWSYVAIVILAALEGPFLSMLLGVLIKLDYFALIPIYVSLMIGDLLGDIFWYYIGYRYGYGFVDRYGKYVSVNRDNISKVLAIFRDHEGKILFLSKISNGLTLALAILITAGIARVPFSKYLLINAIGQIIWTGLLIAIGYFFGDLYLQVDTWLGRASIVGLFLIVIVAFFGYKRYLAKRAEQL